MPEIVLHCPLCGSSKKDLFDQRDSFGYTVINRLCRNCGLVYQSPRMTEDELDGFYEREYREIYQGSQEPTQKDKFVQSGRADAFLSFIGGDLQQGDRFLDIGSSTGILIERVKAAAICEVVGIEPGKMYREYSLKSSLPVYPSLENMREETNQKFDWISMGHVLEHIPKPVSYLIDLREKSLKLDGRLLIEVPNVYMHDSFEVAHMTSFSKRSLGNVLQQAGFKVVKSRLHGQPRSELLPLYITVLAEPHKEGPTGSIIPERYVGLKRQAGLIRRRFTQKFLPKRAWLPLPQES